MTQNSYKNLVKLNGLIVKKPIKINTLAVKNLIKQIN
jgi:hypothetical protein